jgi:hypothetical protein
MAVRLRVQAQPARGLPALQAVPDLGLPSMPEIQLPATADALLAPLPAPIPQGGPPEADPNRAYTAFYKLLPVVNKNSGYLPCN